jgi:FkbM family methyltransferase
VARRLPGCTVHAYEPLEESFELLLENCALNGVTNVVAHRQAVGARDGRLAVVPRDVAVMSGTSAAADLPEAPHVEALSLESVFRSGGIGTCDYLKIDCEGAEFDILPAAEAETLARARHICLEYHDNARQWTHHALVDLLGKRGFRVRTAPSPVHWYLGMLHAARDV